MFKKKKKAAPEQSGDEISKVTPDDQNKSADEAPSAVKKVSVKAIKVVVALLIVALVAFIAIKVGFGSNKDIVFSDDAIIKSDVQPSLGKALNDEGLTLFADNGILRLEYSPKDDLFIITHLETGKVFRSYPEAISEITLEEGETSDIGAYSRTRETGQSITSPVMIGYTKSGIDGGFVVGVNQMKHVKTVHFIENGVRLQYEMLDLELEFSVEITIDGTALKYKIPRNGIIERPTHSDEKENRRPLLASLGVLPYFGAHRADDEGYYVSPDGPGALTYFNVARVTNYNEYSKKVYGRDETVDQLDSPDYSNSALTMGVYGIMDQDSMIAAFIDVGESNALLNIANPGIRNLPFYSIYFLYQYRYYYKQQISKSGTMYDMIVPDMTIGDIEQTMHISVDTEKSGQTDSAEAEQSFTYRDLAVLTREKLLKKWETKWGISESDIMAKRSGETSVPAMNLQLFMGAQNIFGGMLDQVNVMTTFDDVRTIYNAIAADGISNIRFSLLGWQKGGYYGNITNKYKPDSAFGGKGDLIDLAQWAKDTGIELSLDNNLLEIYGKPSGLSLKGTSQREAVVKRPNTFYLDFNIPSMSGIYWYTPFYMMSPAYYNAKLLAEDIDKLTDYGITSVDLQQVGDMVNSDYNQQNALLRVQTVKMYTEWLKKYNDHFDRVSVYYGNEYTVPFVDSILDIPMNRSYSIVLDEQVPFVQMVYHGLVDYYSSALNKEDDPQTMLLRSLEYGALPSFELTKEESKELQNTYYYGLYRSEYTLFTGSEGELKKAYEIAQNILLPLRNESIVDHAQADLQASVFVTTYSNGTRIYVNYESSPYTVTLPDGSTAEIAANSYYVDAA